MTEEIDSSLQSLVSNVVNAKHFSHCRLCLKYLDKHFVRFHDLVTLDTAIADFRPLSDIITDLFGEQICEEIPGIDAICPDCVDKALETARFLEKCKSANNKLCSILHNLEETLNVDINLSGQEQSLYIVVEENDSKIILVGNATNEKVKSKSKKVKCQFECFACNEDFDEFDELKAHNLSTHGYLTCDICHDVYNSNDDLLYHLNNTHKYECDHCKIRRDTQEQLEDHIDLCHTLYVCKQCGISCQGSEKLQLHEQKHNTHKKNQCPKCGKVYCTKEFFQRHVKLCFEDRIDPHPMRTEIVKTLFCKICGKGYSSYGGLRVHNRFAHGNAKPHVCKLCGKEFTAPSYLKTHMIKHTGEKNFKCEICGNRFVSKEALLYHTRRHTGEKPYSCKQCNEKFVNASARAEHIKYKHVGPTLMCEICSQKFVTTNFLKQHMNRHRDPTSKLYVSKTPDMPGEENYKTKIRNNHINTS
ncbi:unnamed protein product [Diatraea saccharalis]|uniref:Uncharacterized protein n=1 Tax=Diatraea saccharalis TaxID=40085 RepID=A0A9P0CBF8_9NEOP|nr:unnamed protein product [Diatraea saccharalis]